MDHFVIFGAKWSTCHVGQCHKWSINIWPVFFMYTKNVLFLQRTHCFQFTSNSDLQDFCSHLVWDIQLEIQVAAKGMGKVGDGLGPHVPHMCTCVYFNFLFSSLCCHSLPYRCTFIWDQKQWRRNWESFQ